MLKETLQFIQSTTNLKPHLGIILGSGLGDLIQKLDDPIFIPYESIPNFPKANVQGHANQLVLGKWHGKAVAMMQGRFHYYEGFSMKEVTYPIQVLKGLGVQNLLVTNACGAINTEYQPGDIVLIDDFINFVFNNPLIGPHDPDLGPRFVDMTTPYCPDLQTSFEKANPDKTYHHGVYSYFSGPYYETKAEIRAFGRLGADLIGMSTVPETILANALGLHCLGISIVTNMATGLRQGSHSHQEVVDIANQAAKGLMEDVDRWVKSL